MELLLKSGADKEVEDIEERTPADLASSLAHYDVATLLAGGVLISKTIIDKMILHGHQCLSHSLGNVSFSDSDFFDIVNKGKHY